MKEPSTHISIETCSLLLKPDSSNPCDGRCPRSHPDRAGVLPLHDLGQAKSAHPKVTSMNQRALTVTVSIAVALTIASGYVAGQMTLRWGISNELADASARIQSFPEKIGEWTLTDRQDLPDEA